MSDSREPSYYEVALTHRQVLVSFLVLLASLVAAFLSGVWVGRPAAGSSPAPASPAAPATAVADLDRGADPAAAGSGLPQLDYFRPADGEEVGDGGDGMPPEGGSGPAGAVGGAGTTLAEDLGEGEEDLAAPRDGDAPLAARRPDPSPGPPKWRQRREAEREVEDLERQFDERSAAADQLQAAATGEPVAGPAAQPSAQPPAPQPPAAQGPAPSPAGGPSAAGSSAAGPPPAGTPVFVVQVISTREQAKAREVLSWLQDGGYPASLSILERPAGIWYRVRVGPYAQRPAADRVADEVRRKFRLDTWITSE